MLIQQTKNELAPRFSQSRHSRMNFSFNVYDQLLRQEMLLTQAYKKLWAITAVFSLLAFNRE